MCMARFRSGLDFLGEPGRLVMIHVQGLGSVEISPLRFRDVHMGGSLYQLVCFFFADTHVLHMHSLTL